MSFIPFIRDYIELLNTVYDSFGQGVALHDDATMGLSLGTESCHGNSGQVRYVRLYWKNQ